MIRPTGSNVVIRPTEEHISDVIHVAELNRAPSCYGFVIAVGPKVIDLQPGEKVFCGRYEGSKLNPFGPDGDLRIVPLETILGKFTPENS